MENEKDANPEKEAVHVTSSKQVNCTFLIYLMCNFSCIIK